MEKAYAQGLLSAITNGMDPDKAVQSLHDLLVKEGRRALLPGIARALSELSAILNTQDQIKVTVAKKDDEVHATKAAISALSAIGKDNASMHTRIDPTIIGGWRAEGGGTLIDNSFKSHLLALFNMTAEIT